MTDAALKHALCDIFAITPQELADDNGYADARKEACAEQDYYRTLLLEECQRLEQQMVKLLLP